MTDATITATPDNGQPPAPITQQLPPEPLIGPEPTVRATSLSSAQLQSARQTWIEAGLDPAAFDQAAKNDGLDPTPPDPEIKQHFEEHGLPQAPTPADYNVVYARSFVEGKSTELLAGINAEVTAWAAATGLPPAIGVGIIDRLVQLTELQAMKPAARELWVREQQAISLRRAGSEEKLAETRKQALAALGIAKDNVFSQAFANSAALNDVWILHTLANHSRAIEASYRRASTL